MINKNLVFLKSKATDKDLHSPRIMFCLKDGKVEVAPANIMDSHIEWFEKEGWITNKNTQDFLNQNIRGFYLPGENKLYCYKGAGFSFDDKVLPELLEKIAELKQYFSLNDNTEIHLGPRDSSVDDTEYKRIFVGTLKELKK